jgi:NADH dehydrogenase/NADH:ubiquinone oxidoreductase subunit G
MALTHLRIDGKAIECEAGLTILQAASQVGLYLPALCTHPGLPAEQAPLDSCGLCTIEILGRPEPVRACETVIEEGMVVISDSESLKLGRDRKLELILADHPHEDENGEGRCPICELGQHIAKVDHAEPEIE